MSFFSFIHHKGFYFELWTGQLTRSTSIDGCTNESWEQNASDRIAIKMYATNDLPHQRNKTRWQSVGWSVSRPLSFLRPLLSAAPYRRLNMYVTGRLRATSYILECWNIRSGPSEELRRLRKDTKWQKNKNRCLLSGCRLDALCLFNSLWSCTYQSNNPAQPGAKMNTVINAIDLILI